MQADKCIERRWRWTTNLNSWYIEYRHPITVTSLWAQMRLKSPTSGLFAQPFIQAQIKENIKAPRHWPLWEESTADHWIPHMGKALPRHDFGTTPPFPVFGHRQHVANPTFLQSRTLRPFTPPDVPEDAINGSRADEDANLATLSPPGLNTLADIAQATVSNAFHSEYHVVLIQVLCN